MATILILLFIMYRTIFAEFYRIVLFDNTNQTNLQNNICYMTNTKNENNHWCELMTRESTLTTMKTCMSINESLPILDDVTRIDQWIDQSISTTNCSYFLLSSMTKSQKHILTIIQSILLLILFLPFLLKLSLILIQYCFY
jgi:hypothetical protein